MAGDLHASPRPLNQRTCAPICAFKIDKRRAPTASDGTARPSWQQNVGGKVPKMSWQPNPSTGQTSSGSLTDLCEAQEAQEATEATDLSELSTGESAIASPSPSSSVAVAGVISSVVAPTSATELIMASPIPGHAQPFGALIGNNSTGPLMDLHLVCQAQEQMIAQLKQMLLTKEEELRETRCQLDKYKSVLSTVDSFGIALSPLSPKLKTPRKTRLMGISAEPQASSSIQDLINCEFPVFSKDDKLVIDFFFNYLHLFGRDEF